MSATSAATATKVLVAEDDLEIADMLRMTLS